MSTTGNGAPFQRGSRPTWMGTTKPGTHGGFTGARNTGGGSGSGKMSPQSSSGRRRSCCEMKRLTRGIPTERKWFRLRSSSMMKSCSVSSRRSRKILFNTSEVEYNPFVHHRRRFHYFEILYSVCTAHVYVFWTTLFFFHRISTE
ncbi:unnamed protein product [Amoebophrya sp. A120]|nr:unnamed protein product [Amoebophrya sp. A120]|eukprot:GSA120T00016493001.1